MPLPAPEIGLLVSYEYLWKRQEATQNAEKARPCCVILVHLQSEQDDMDQSEVEATKVVYLPISHVQPDDEQTGFELSPHAKKVAGLDMERQWVVVSECNLDTWPVDVRKIPGTPGRFHYGYLPPNEFEKIKRAFLEFRQSKKLKVINRI